MKRASPSPQLGLLEADAAAPPHDAHGAAQILAAPQDDAIAALARALPPLLRLGTSSWYFPGWRGLVWGGDYAQAVLSRRGLSAYHRHPLLRTVSVDASFYRPLPASKYAEYAAQVDADFRFLVKAPALVCDALLRERDGARSARPAPNPGFLDAALARSTFIEPAMQGLGAKAGVLVFELSPLPRRLLQDMPALLARLGAFMRALPPAAGVLHALEVRNPELLTPPLTRLLKDCGWQLCLALHALMPPIAEQLPVLRALWPAPLVCRWTLQRGLKYEQARSLWEPFDRLAAPDPDTRDTLARVIAATVFAGHPAFVTVNNKAEGSAPLSVIALAQAVLREAARRTAAAT
jgi:uncharacterized protein YecE (DUF72 family)